MNFKIIKLVLVYNKYYCIDGLLEDVSPISIVSSSSSWRIVCLANIIVS